MRSPEVAHELPELVRAGALRPERAAPLLAVARGDVVSVRAELRALLGLGVALVTAGVGLFVREHHAALGPGVVALLLAAAAGGCLVAAARRAAPFTWGRAADADWILDGLALLAVAFVGAELAWIETRYAALGADWPWHLLVVSLLAAVIAGRFDSTAAWTLALATFAAWRGVAVLPRPDQLERAVSRGDAVLRWNLLLCALVFALVGAALARFDRKRHFEPATSFLAALAAAVAGATGLGLAGVWPLWALTLVALGGLVARAAFAGRRLGLFALGALAIYVGTTRFLFEIPGWQGLGCFWFSLTSVGAVAVLVVVHRRFRAAAPPEAAR